MIYAWIALIFPRYRIAIFVLRGNRSGAEFRVEFGAAFFLVGNRRVSEHACVGSALLLNVQGTPAAGTLYVGTVGRTFRWRGDNAAR